ncbi:MAG: hypothetical protein LBE70_02040 [Nitrososphaerota archaeon]|nr:hypothetical protein [Nitrososphaerota archaeon]
MAKEKNVTKWLIQRSNTSIKQCLYKNCFCSTKHYKRNNLKITTTQDIKICETINYTTLKSYRNT